MKERLDGLIDEQRPVRPPSIRLDQIEQVVGTTLEQTPRDAIHWSRKSMADRSGLSKSTVGRIWRDFGLNRTGRTRSNCPPIRSSSRRWSTSSACTTIHPNGPWCCAWTKSPKSRPWTGPSPCCR
ncbi:helix-turn-helix domain-containing protein [Dactylosporangium sp. NPDC000244]|uniref:helix-turn-helix domain-containing protein n=1 Tax=Dactylosporangium sp. NPDC000244 TaxID=3154365 RepID=UPI00332EC3A8